MLFKFLINRRLDLLSVVLTFVGIGAVKFWVDSHFQENSTKERNKHALVIEQIQSRLDVFEASRIRALELLAKNWPLTHPNIEQWFTNESLDILYILPAINSIWFKSAKSDIQWRVPVSTQSEIDISTLNIALDTSIHSIQTFHISLNNDRESIAYAQPLIIDAQLTGWLISVIDIKQALAFLVQEFYQSGKYLRISDGNSDLMKYGELSHSFTYNHAFSFGAKRLSITLDATNNTSIKYWYFYFGVATCMLFGVILRILFYKSAKAQISQQRFVAASKSSLDGLLLFSADEGQFVLKDYNNVAATMLNIDASRAKMSYSTLLNSLNLANESLKNAPEHVKNGQSFDDSFHVSPSINNIAYIKLQIVSAGSDIAITIRDITPRKMAEFNLRDREEKYRRLVEGLTGHFLYRFNNIGELEYVSHSIKQILGFDAHEFVENYQLYLTKASINDELAKRTLFRNNSNAGLSYHLEFMNHMGDIKLIEFTDSPVFKDNKLVAIEGIAKDITKEKALANELAYQANHDALTGLFNRYAFDVQLKKIIKRVLEQQLEATLCYLDLDQFKIVNDSAGHQAGDELLNQLGLMIAQTIEERHIVARLGGDEFGIIFIDCDYIYVAQEAKNLLQRINEFRFVWEDCLFRVSASIGLATIKQGQSAEELMKAADVACYVAKDTGRNRINVYSEEDEELNFHKSRINWANRIQEALEQNRFELYCQSIQSLESLSSIEVNFEILIRMIGNDGELISPALFIPAAERFNLMSTIDRWVVFESLTQLAKSRDLLPKINKCAINLSGASIVDTTFAKQIIDTMQALQIPPDKICFEITETEAVTKLNHAESFITTLRNFGCKFALDDFGAGMCSFSYLKNLPVDSVKIDGHFVKNLRYESTDRAIVKAICDIAKSLNKQTIAEFVGDEPTKQMLADIGVDYVQGYYIDRPRPMRDYIAELKQRDDFKNNEIIQRAG